MLANKESLQKWIEAGRQPGRADEIGDIETQLRRNSEYLITDNVITNCSINLGHKELEGFTFKMNQPSYKSAPVGLIHDVEVVIDGEAVPREDIQLILKRGQRIMLYNARTIQDIWWDTYEPVKVFVPWPGGLPAGEHELEVTLAEQISEYYGRPLNMTMATRKVAMRVE